MNPIKKLATSLIGLVAFAGAAAADTIQLAAGAAETQCRNNLELQNLGVLTTSGARLAVEFPKAAVGKRICRLTMVFMNNDPVHFLTVKLKRHGFGIGQPLSPARPLLSLMGGGTGPVVQTQTIKTNLPGHRISDFGFYFLEFDLPGNPPPPICTISSIPQAVIGVQIEYQSACPAP